MCGIAGILALPGSPPPSMEILRAMCATLVHRGPDDDGFFLEGSVGFGMTRLSIIDVAGGHQPLFNEDRSVRVVFNGEIYNFRELRRELERSGHRFASGSDGEVVVHLWEEVGLRFPERLNGMYAIALHDGRRGRLVLVRDRLGVKPLFYAIEGGWLLFASEAKALLASGRVPRDLDLDSLAQFLAWEYVPGPRTLFRSVQKLDPATMLIAEETTGTIRTAAYWDVPPEDPASGRNDAPRTASGWEEAVDSKIQECVRRQLVSDVPLGAFLSGGVDSSLVVAGMGDARTFSIGFDDPSYNELPWASAVARHLGVSHRTEVVRPDAVSLFEHLMGFMEDPIADVSIFPTYLVSKLAREEVKVCLSGDGGDECFGGYEGYVADGASRIWATLPRPIRKGILEPGIRCLPPREEKKGWINKAKRFVEGLAFDPGLRHARWRLFVGERLRSELFSPEVQAALTTPVGEHIHRLLQRSGPRSPGNQMLYVDLKSYLVDNCLVKVDRMSMACSLEARVPLLDHELVELAFRVPWELKVSRGRTKVLLKRVAARRLPRETVYRPKEGFSIPMKNWLRGQLRPFMEELLSPARVAAEGLFQVSTVERLKREHLDGVANWSHVLWSLIVFQEWRRRWSG